MAKDVLGNELQKGDVVAYGVRSGNSGELHFGVIVNPDRPTLYGLYESVKRIHPYSELKNRDDFWAEENCIRSWKATKRAFALSGFRQVVKLDKASWMWNEGFVKVVSEVRQGLR